MKWMMMRGQGKEAGDSSEQHEVRRLRDEIDQLEAEDSVGDGAAGTALRFHPTGGIRLLLLERVEVSMVTGR